jgi:hypothetical protein
MTNLEILDISSSYQDFLDLSKLVKLKKLCLRRNLSISKISTLTLEKVNVYPELLKKLPPSVKFIKCEGYSTQNEFHYKILKRFINLESIEFFRTKIHDDQMTEILDSLPNIKKLKFFDCDFIVGTFLKGRNIEIIATNCQNFDSKYINPFT